MCLLATLTSQGRGSGRPEGLRAYSILPHTLLTAGVGAVLAGTCCPTDKGSQEVSPSQTAPLPHLVNGASPRKPRGNVSLLVRP